MSEKMERLARTLSEHVSLAVANVRLRESLRIQATKDGLTGLFNRRFMEEILERELRRALRTKRQLAVFMVDPSQTPSLLLIELAPGVSLDEVREKTSAHYVEALN